MPLRMRMRWTAYAGVSTALTAGVVLKALAQRPNFYSAAVYLSQSSANLMILTNFIFVVACTFLLGLQKLLYGNLRPIEIEQLYEKAWFAVTETCLAMTVFRGEIGLTFLAMFFSLLTGKVWGWIGEGRVEILEQQPPRDPRWFHSRLALSLGLSVAFDLTMLEYVVKQVMRMARPDMMVMFGFEFAVLAITSISTAMRYAIDLVEIGIVREQKRHRIEEIKRERVQAAVTEFQTSQTATSRDATDADTTPTPTQRTADEVSEEAMNRPVDDNEVEVEGWEDKGRYMFYLNLATDFFKLVTYLTFFMILLVFYGLPIHILRDVFLTMRSFLKRISDFMKYRTATRDMNARYPDATAEEIGREDVCIICREEMRPYEPPVAEPGQPQPRVNPVAERMRPKKLPCGHVLHFSCLRSWLERQQICPTCRANVVQTGGAATGTGGAAQGGVGQANGGQHPPARQGPRVYQLGPLGIGVGRGDNMFEQLQRQLADGRQPAPGAQPQNADPNAPNQFGVGLRWTRRRRAEQELTAQQQLDALEARLQQDVQDLAQNANELNVLRSMQAELQRLRGQRLTRTHRHAHTTAPAAAVPMGLPQPSRQRLTMLSANDQQNVLHAGSDQLPAGLALPEGWSMMPLQASQQITVQQQQQHPAHLHHPVPQTFPPMPMIPPFSQFPMNMMPQPFQPQNPQPNAQAQVPNTNTQNNQSESVQANGILTNPDQQRQQVHHALWGMPTQNQMIQQLHHQHHQQLHQQQHEQALANMRNQTGQGSLLNRMPSTANNTSTQSASAGATTSNAGEPINGNTLAAPPSPAAPQGQSMVASPLPAWGSTSHERSLSNINAHAAADGAANARASQPTMNGTHAPAQESENSGESSSAPSQRKRHATVEDLVEDPD